MAITECDVKVTNITELGDRPNTDDSLSADELKQLFDKTGKDLKDFINDMIDEIEAQYQLVLSNANKLDPAFLDVNSNQLRPIYVTSVVPTGSSPEGIYLVTE